MFNANFVAPLVFWLSVPITVLLFRRFPPAKACALSLLGAAMFLPEQFFVDPPLFPAFDKLTLPPLAALLGALLYARGRLIRPPQAVDLLFVFGFLGTIVTVLLNDFPVPYEAGVEPALVPFDIFAVWIRDFLGVLAPFLLGRALFTTREDLYTFAKILAAGGLVYSLLMLVEVRMSPQLHNWTYGYHQHRFDQTFRFGGYRPMVYMTHGLNCARFMLGCLLTMAALSRARPRFLGAPSWVWVVYLTLILALSRSAGAWVLGAVCLPLVAFGSVKLQVRVATLLAVFVLAYPILRVADQVPIEAVLDWAYENIGPERARSLEDRFDQEDLLTDKHRARLLFGWGPNRYSIWDPILNEWQTVDGEWLHIFGRRGLWGFLCFFGLYLAPVWALRRNIGLLRPSDAKLAAGLTLMQAVFTFDNIPNSAGSLPQYFIAGVLYGGISGLVAQTARERLERRRQAKQKRLEALARRQEQAELDSNNA